MQMQTAENEKEKEGRSYCERCATHDHGEPRPKEKKERDESKPAKERRSTGSQMLAYLRESTDEEMTLRTKANEKLMGEGHEDLLKVK